MTKHRVVLKAFCLAAWSIAWSVPGAVLGQAANGPAAQTAKPIPPPRPPRQFEEPKAAAFLEKVSAFIRVGEARQEFAVSGDGMAVAVLDTGIRGTHVDFQGRIPARRNFTEENGGNAADATDLVGHGTNVAGIIAAGGDHIGMAPKARIIPLKVLEKLGGDWGEIEQALKWVLDHDKEYGITVVNLSLGATDNWRDPPKLDAGSPRARIHEHLRSLREKRIAVVVAAGNSYFTHKSEQGMGFPAICREAISVGAVYDADWGSMTYADGAKAFRTAADQITPFSQRLLETPTGFRTTVFAPGAPILSTGIKSDHGESLQEGTSQASPVIAGVILLMQEYYRRESPLRQLPPIDSIDAWLRAALSSSRTQVRRRTRTADWTPMTTSRTPRATS